MAEIKIEKKKPIWPWVIVVLIILAAIYFFWYYNDTNLNSSDDMAPMQDTISQTDNDYIDENDRRDTTYLYSGNYGTVSNETALADYFVFVDNMENRDSDKAYYRSAFFKLINATKRQAEIDSVDISENISAAMKNAENLTNDQTTATKSDSAKQAAEEVAKALRKIQEKEYNNLSDDAQQLAESVSAIDGSKNLDTQSTNVDTFFDRSARLLQKMNNNENNR